MKAFGVVVLLVTALVTAAWWQGPIKAQQREAKTVSFADTADAPAAAPVAGSRRVFGDRDARRLGITFRSVREALKELKAAGAIDGTESNAELAVAVADNLSSKPANKAAFGDAAIDWNALIAVIERLVALILKLLPLFV